MILGAQTKYDERSQTWMWTEAIIPHPCMLKHIQNYSLDIWVDLTAIPMRCDPPSDPVHLHMHVQNQPHKYMMLGSRFL